MESKGINEVKRSIPWIDLLLSLSCWLLALYILLAVRHFPRLTAAVEVIGSEFVPKLIAYCLAFLGAWLLVTSVLLKREDLLKREEVTPIEIDMNNLERILLLVVGSLIKVLQQKCGLRLVRSCDTVAQVIARGEEARLLGVKDGTPLLLVEGVLYGEGGEPLRYGRGLYRGDKFKLTLENFEVLSRREV